MNVPFIHRALQLHVAMTASLATLLLGMGQRNGDLPLLMILAATSAFFLTDVWRWIRLNFFWANLIVGSIFLVLLLWNITQLRGTAQVLAIANVLAYLQIFCLFQEKDPRTCWILALLGLLQVVVAAALDQGFWFGLLLVAYLAAAPSTLGLLCVFRDQSETSRQSPAAAQGSTWPNSSKSRSQNIISSFQSHDPIGDQSQQQVFRLIRKHVGRVLITTLVATLVIFYLIPRPRGAAWRGLMTLPVRMVGFTERVRLGELGRIIQSPQEVLRIRFRYPGTETTYPVEGSVYLRGVILTYYQSGQWFHIGSEGGLRLQMLPASSRPQIPELVEQVITIEPMDRPELFCVWPIVNVNREQRLLLDTNRNALNRPLEHMGQRFQYELLTPAFYDGQQWPIMPAAFSAAGLPQFTGPPKEALAAVYPNLVALVDQWVELFSVSPEDPFTLARVLERQLRDGGGFQYSLQGQPRDLSLDPIEDFVSRNPRGHCEYFATALALMLRSCGIPCRLIVGYRTEEWNPLGRFFQVRQYHAHTWVEAYIPISKIPQDMKVNPQLWEGAPGAWLRLDPTPAADAVPRGGGWLGLGHWLNWLDFVWHNYIVEMDRARQYDSIYSPTAQVLRETWERVAVAFPPVRQLGLRIQSWVQYWQEVLNRLNWQAALLIAGILLVAIGGIQLLFKWVFRLFQSCWKRIRWSRNATGSRIEFYNQLERILGRWGLERQWGQTPREFALQASRWFIDRAEHRLATWPPRIVEIFYRIRFGGDVLAPEEEREVGRALWELDHWGQRRVPLGAGELAMAEESTSSLNDDRNADISSMRGSPTDVNA